MAEGLEAGEGQALDVLEGEAGQVHCLEVAGEVSGGVGLRGENYHRFEIISLSLSVIFNPLLMKLNKCQQFLFPIADRLFI